MHGPSSTLFLMFNQALARDGYQCMITRMIDETSLGRCADLRTIQQRDRINAVTIQTAHTLNDSTMQDTDPAETSENVRRWIRCGFIGRCRVLTRYPDSRWRYGHSGVLWIVRIRRGFRTTRCSRSPNLLSLEPNFRHKFNNLDLWFESTLQVCCLETR